MHWRYLSNIQALRHFARIWCNIWRTWKIDGNNLSIHLLQGLLWLLLDKRDDFADQNEDFYNLSIKKILNIN